MRNIPQEIAELETRAKQLTHEKSSTSKEPVVWMYEEHSETMFGRPDGYRPDDAVPLYTKDA
jgi:hypothetical protein